MKMDKKACATVASLAVCLVIQGCGQRADQEPAKSTVASEPAVATALGSDSNPELAKKVEETRRQIEDARNAPNEPAKPTEPESKWSYRTKEDKMRGKTRYVASLDSSDMIQLEFPYAGGSTLGLTLRDDPEYGKDVMLTLDKGQLPCASYDGCSFKVKFDDGPVQHISAAGPESGHGDVLFISGPAGRKKFMSGLRTAKKMIVEVSVYDAGRQQFTFEPAGLKWERF